MFGRQFQLSCTVASFTKFLHNCTDVTVWAWANLIVGDQCHVPDQLGRGHARGGTGQLHVIPFLHGHFGWGQRCHGNLYIQTGSGMKKEKVYGEGEEGATEKSKLRIHGQVLSHQLRHKARNKPNKRSGRAGKHTHTHTSERKRKTHRVRLQF